MFQAGVGPAAVTLPSDYGAAGAEVLGHPMLMPWRLTRTTSGRARRGAEVAPSSGMSWLLRAVAVVWLAPGGLIELWPRLRKALRLPQQTERSPWGFLNSGLDCHVDKSV